MVPETFSLDVVIVRHAEIYTKAEPVRSQFIKILTSNIQRVLPGHKVSNKYWRIVVRGNVQEALEKLSKVFGVSSFSPAKEVDAELDEITEAAVRACEPGKTFAVRTQRLDKAFPLTSQQVNERVGAEIVKRLGLKVRLKNPEQQVNVEIFKGKAYVFTRTLKGPGGLPYGTAGGRAVALADDDLGLFAAWMIMRRGVETVLVGSANPAVLEEWSSGKGLKHVQSGLFQAAEEENALAVVVPQTKEKIRDSFEYFGKGFPVFVPLSAFSEEEARKRMQKVLY